MSAALDTRLQIGGNNPPSPIEIAKGTMAALSDWMKENPVIQDEVKAREAKLLCDRAKASLEEVEQERDKKVRPLNEKVSEINAQYKSFHNTDAKRPGVFDKIFIELKARINAFLVIEEEKRKTQAAEAARIADAKDLIAREAEQRERDALSSAAVGELDIDVAALTAETDLAFADRNKSVHAAAIAERDTHVRLGGGFGRAMSLKNKETLILDDAFKALADLGVTEKIREAILSDARAFRKINDKLPNGVSISTSQSV